MLIAEAQIFKWTFLAVSQVEAHCVDIIFQKKLVEEKDRDFGLVKRAERNLIKPLSVLVSYLAGKDFLVANKFCVAESTWWELYLMRAMQSIISFLIKMFRGIWIKFFRDLHVKEQKPFSFPALFSISCT